MAFTISVIAPSASIAPASATSPLPAPNACSPTLCVGFPLGLEPGLSIRPEIEISSAGGRTVLIARYARDAEIRVTSDKLESSLCSSADGQWRRAGPHRIEAHVALATARFRTESECRFLTVETEGLSESFEQGLVIDIWQMTDYYLGQAGEFVQHPVEQSVRLRFRDVD